ncbi:MAG: hypothetical protein AAB683_01955 [Patescibacteria group bacterium]
MNNKNILGIVIVIVVLIGATVYFKSTRLSKDTSIIVAPNTITMATSSVSNSPLPKVTSPKQNVSVTSLSILSDQGTSVIVKDKWGIFFVKRDEWKTATNTDKTIVLEQSQGIYKGDKITISYEKENSISDGDIKNGIYTFYWNLKEKKWSVDITDDKGMKITGQNPQIVLMKFKNTAPVFLGKSPYRTYIVALSPMSFIKLNITGQGNTEPLDNILNDMKLIKDYQQLTPIDN